MTRRYSLALALVALLSCVAYVVLSRSINTQEHAAAKVNDSGRQRMLSQRLALYALRLAGSDDPTVMASYRAEIDRCLRIFVDTHQELSGGSLSPALHALYFDAEHGLDPVLRRYVAAVERYRDTADPNALQALLRIGPDHLLPMLDAIVQQYQRESEADVRFLYGLETAVLLVTLTTLVVEAVWIFAPMVRRVERDRAGLLRAERLRAYTGSLEQKNRLLDQFAYAASHDLKAPLRAIANLSRWLREDLDGHLPASSDEHLRLLEDRVLRLEQLVQGLHRYATIGISPHARQRIDLQHFFQEILIEADPEHRFQQRLDLEVDSIDTDRTLLWQACANLVGNAVRHHHRPQEGCIRIATSALPGGCRILIEDNGPGIPAEHHERIFGIFQTLRAKDSSGGLGLGLALVRRIAEDVGARIQLQSAPGTGSRFLLDWPLSEVGLRTVEADQA